MNASSRRIVRSIAYDLIGNLLLGISISCFAVYADFAPGGVSGLAVMGNHLFAWPIGLATVCINVPVILCTFRLLGLRFFIDSAITTLIGALMVDFILVSMPDPHLSRWTSAVLAGVCAGGGYALIFRKGSSTGGTDFIIVALKRWKPKLTFGFLAFLIDGLIILLSVFVYHDLRSFALGMIYTVLASLTMDLITRQMDLWEQKHSRNIQNGGNGT